MNRKGFLGWIVKTGWGSVVNEDSTGKLWHAHNCVTIFKTRKKVNQIIKKAKNMVMSNNKAYSLRVYENE